MRAAIFAPVERGNDDLIGHLAESAILSQWAHSWRRSDLYYARWEKGEIDLVNMAEPNFSPMWAVEIKWSDSLDHPERRFAGLKHFIEAKKLASARITTKTAAGLINIAGIAVPCSPSSLYCYEVGKNLASHAPFGSSIPEDR